MRSLTISVLTVFAMCALALPLQADYILQIDLDSATNGIQTTRTVNVGDTVTANLFLNLTAAGDTLSAYNFDVSFSEALLTFQSRVESAGNLGGGFFSAANGKETSGGFVRQLDGITTIGISGAFANPIQIASITFTAKSAGVSTIQSGAFNSNFNQWFDNTKPFENNITGLVQFGGATVTAVPEPSSLAMLAVVAGVSVMVVRRKRFKSK